MLGANQEESRDVRAGDEENEQDGAEKSQKRRPRLSHDFAMERLHVDVKSDAKMVGIRVSKRLGDSIHLCLGLLERDRRPEPPEDAKCRLVELLRQPAARVSHGIGRFPKIDIHVDSDVSGMPKTEIARKDSHHGERLLVELHDLSEDVRIRAELRLPERVSQEDRVGRLVRCEVATKEGGYLHDGEEILGDPSHLDLERLGAAAEVLAERADGGDPLEEPRPPLVLAKVVSRVAQAEYLPLGPLGPEDHQSVGLRIRKWIQEDCLNDAHEGDGRADPHRENQDDGGGERRGLGERTKDESRIEKHGPAYQEVGPKSLSPG